MSSIAKELSDKLLVNLNDIETAYREHAKELSKLDLYIQDLLHNVEFSKFNVVKGYKMLMEIKKASQKRRQIKDQYELLSSLYDMTMRHKTNIQEANNRIAKREEQLPNRIYTPRVLQDNFIFDKDV